MIRSVLSAIALIAATILVSGCQSSPQPLIIGAVQVNDPLNQPVAQISVTDQRPHAYLYRITHAEDKAEFAPPQQPLTEVISNSLTNLTSSQAGELSWQISIDEALIDGQLGAFNYELQHTIVLRVEAQRGNRTYSNSYRGRLQSKGVGRPDEAVVEREFSQLLRSVLADISNDPKLRNL